MPKNPINIEAAVHIVLDIIDAEAGMFEISLPKTVIMAINMENAFVRKETPK